jgi:DNA-binding response OmpR family regulator
VSVPPLRAPRILVADDDATALYALESLLRAWGYEPVSARNGPEALAILAREDAPRLAILDWVMPEMEGLEVCQRARSLHPSEPPYLILLTGRTTRQDLVAGLEGGADEYLIKPVEADELRARVQAGLRLIELQDRLAERVRQLEEAPLVQEIVGEDHPGLRQTLQLCEATFTEALALPGLPRHVRIALRTCRGLCQETLGKARD